MRVVYESEFCKCDGTFEIVLRDFATLCNFFRRGFRQGEAAPCCHALRRDSYDTLFRKLMDELVNCYRAVGAVHTMILDFEMMTQGATRDFSPVHNEGVFSTLVNAFSEKFRVRVRSQRMKLTQR